MESELKKKAFKVFVCADCGIFHNKTEDFQCDICEGRLIEKKVLPVTEIKKWLEPIANFKIEHVPAHNQTGRCTCCSYNRGMVDLAKMKIEELRLLEKEGEN